MKRMLKGLWQIFLCDPLPLKAAFTVTMLFAAIPPIHAYIGGYIRLFLLWGAAVAVKDLFTRRRLFRQRGWWLLALFTLSYCVTVLVNRERVGISANLSGLLYMLLFFFVLYPCGKEEAERELPVLARIVTAVTGLFCVACLVTFLWGINYSGTVRIHPDYDTPVIIGVLDHRLYGLYNCNTGSSLNLLSSLFSLLLLRRGVGKGERAAHIVNLVLQYICLVLTLSRTAWYMYLVCGALAVFFLLPRLPLGRRWLAEGVQGVCALAAAGLLLVLSVPVKWGMSYMPAIIGSASGETAPAGAAAIPLTVRADVTPVPVERIEDFDEVGLLSDRPQLWQGGWDAFLEHPLFGVSGGGMYDAVAPHVVEWMRGNLHRGGLHSMPLTVLVCSGGVGAVLAAVFLLLTGWRVGAAMWRRRGTDSLLLGAGLILLAILGNELMEARLLYSTTVFGCLFWIMQGYGVCLAEGSDEAA